MMTMKSQISTTDNNDNSSNSNVQPTSQVLYTFTNNNPGDIPARPAPDTESTKRGRRFMSILTGTLKSNSPSLPSGRLEMESKLAQRLAEEKAALELELQREQEEKRMREEEQRRNWEEEENNRLRNIWKLQKDNQIGFLRTKTSPILFWKPSIIDDEFNK